MSKFSFLSDKLSIAAVATATIATVSVVDENVIVTLSGHEDVDIDLGPAQPGLDIKEHLTVEVEPLTHPKNMFILTLKPTSSVPAVAKDKTQARKKTASSPARGTTISNGWNL